MSSLNGREDDTRLNYEILCKKNTTNRGIFYTDMIIIDNTYLVGEENDYDKGC